MVDYENYWKKRIATRVGGDPRTPERVQLLGKHARSGSTILDVGCGNGDASGFLAKLGFVVTGVDISVAAINNAKKRYPELTFHAFEVGGKFPVPDNTFDAVYCADVIEHVMDTQSLLSEIVRVLKPGALALISTPYHGIAKNVSLAVWGFEKHFDPTGPHIRFFTVNSLNRLAKKTGLRVVTYYFLGRIKWLSKNMVLIAQKSA